MDIADDLRGFIVQLEAHGELQRVDVEVDGDFEIGAITRRINDLRAPAALFERIESNPSGYRVLGCPIGPSTPNLHARLAIAMGLPSDTPPVELIESFCERANNPIAPVTVSDAPCKENVHVGDDVNLFDLPVPRLRELDGGGYLGAWSICLTKDPDTGWVNWAIYRAMIHDERTLGMLLHRARQHGGHLYYTKYEPRNLPMPIAIAIGTDILSTVAGASSFPYGVNEADMSGGLRGRPVEVVPCETVDLEVPATSEIIVEGVVPPHERRPEGPYGEYTGYSVQAEPMPIINVTCVSHRDDPIFTTVNLGKPWDDGDVVASVATSGVALQALRNAGVTVNAVYAYAPNLSLIVSAPPIPGSGVRIISTLWSGATRTDLPYVVIVDDDVDVTNIEEVWWAITTRMHPRNGIHIIDGKVANPLIPWLTPAERERGRETSGVYWDARFPSEWPEEYKREHCFVTDFEHAWSAETQQKVIQRWSEYGFRSTG